MNWLWITLLFTVLGSDILLGQSKNKPGAWKPLPRSFKKSWTSRIVRYRMSCSVAVSALQSSLP